MMKYIFIAITVVLFSCKSTQEIAGYEYTQKQQLNSHWQNETTINVSFEKGNKFTLKITEGANYGEFPILDTVTIVGSFLKSRNGYKLTSTNDSKIKFVLKKYNNKINFKGSYFNKRQNEYVNIKNVTTF